MNRPVLQYFKDITRIPLPSGDEEKICRYLRRFAEKDTAGNICIRKLAAVGFEASPIVVLQAHMDMVCEKDPAKAINFATDLTETVI